MSHLAVGEVVAGWRVTAAAPAEEGLRRWRAVSEAGAEAELLALWPPGAVPATEQSRFAAHHRALLAHQDPHTVRTLSVVMHEGAPIAVRAPLDDLTLADVAGPLPAEQVAAIGARLLAALHASPVTASALFPEDVGLDAAGHPVLATRGRSAQVTPSNRRDFLPPEGPGPAAPLYGLGVALFQLATGRLPLSGRGAHAGPPPSAFRAHIPVELDRAVQALLSPDPASRAGALPWLQAAAGGLPDLRAHRRAGASGRTMSPGQVVFTTQGEAKRAGALDGPRPRAYLAVPAARLRTLDGDTRSRLAAAAGVPMRTLLDAERAGQPLVLGGWPSAQEALQAKSALVATDAEAFTPAGWLRPVAAVGFAGGALFLAMILALIHPAAALIGLLGLLVPLLLAGTWLRDRGQLAAIEAQWLAQRRVGEHAPASVRPLQDRISALRRRISASELSAPAQADLRTALTEVEEHLLSLARLCQQVDEALSAADPTGAKARLAAASAAAAKDPKAAALRDRLAQTVADLDALSVRRTELEQDLAALHAALDEVDASLAHTAIADASHAAVDALQRTARLAREAAAAPAQGARPQVAE